MGNSKKTAADKVGEQVEAAVAAGKGTVETFVKTSSEVAGKATEDVLAATREHVDAAYAAGVEAIKDNESLKTYREFAALGKGNLDALMASNATFVRAMGEAQKMWFGAARTTMEEGTNAARAMWGCKTLQELTDVQAGYVKETYAALLSEGRRLSEASVKLAEETLAPIAAQADVATRKWEASRGA